MNRTETKRQAGVLIVFGEDVSPEKAKEILGKIVAVHGDDLDYEPKLQTFNPDWGYPVFYIP